MSKLLIILFIINFSIVFCLKNNTRLRKNSERIQHIRNNDDENSNIFPGKNIRTFNEKTLPKVEGDLKFLNDSPNRKLFGEGTKETQLEVSVGKKSSNSKVLKSDDITLQSEDISDDQSI